MPDPAAPAPPPAACLGAAGREVRRHRRRRTRRDRPAAARARPVRPRPQRGPPPPLLDEEDESAAGFDAGLDESVRRVAGDEARAAAAHGGPDGGAPQSPARVSICLQPSDLPRSGKKSISKCFHNERICRTRPGAPPRAGSRTAARRRAPRGLQFACNPLISPDPPKNPFPNISRPKGFVGRCGRRRFRPGSSFPARRVASGGAATARSGHCRATAIAPGVETSSPNRRARLGEGARDEPSAGRMRA